MRSIGTHSGDAGVRVTRIILEIGRKQRFRGLAQILIMVPFIASERSGALIKTQRTMKTIIVMTSLAILPPALDVAVLDAAAPVTVAETASAETPAELREPWAPSADIAEDEREYNIILELPGFAKSDFDVSVENGWIHVSGERQMPDETNGRLFNRIERKLGDFERRFRVPEDADATTISAEYRDGLLTVRIAKDPDAGQRRIEVEFK